MRQRDEVIHQRGWELLELVARDLPRYLEIVRDPEDAWPAFGVGLLCRMATTLTSILELQRSERETDAAILVRSLYEHAVHFAWLSADPSAERMEAWRKQDLRDRLKADDDTTAHGVPMLRPEIRALFLAQVANMRGDPLVLADLASAADKGWEGQLLGMKQHTDIESFRGWYALLYRYYSGMAHPSLRGLNRVFEEATATVRRFDLEPTYKGNGPYGMATIVFGVALFVSARALGWPQVDAVTAVFDRNPDPTS